MRIRPHEDDRTCFRLAVSSYAGRRSCALYMEPPQFCRPIRNGWPLVSSVDHCLSNPAIPRFPSVRPLDPSTAFSFAVPDNSHSCFTLVHLFLRYAGKEKRNNHTGGSGNDSAHDGKLCEKVKTNHINDIKPYPGRDLAPETVTDENYILFALLCLYPLRLSPQYLLILLFPICSASSALSNMVTMSIYFSFRPKSSRSVDHSICRGV
jgi:hypothetical protein